MSLILKNLQSNQQIPLNKENPLIIGRNNVLGCFDKKVSRSHGRITCTENGNINLVALHANPCFFMKKGVPPIRQLNKDEEETLNEGDCLGLLPDTFWFQITNSSAKAKEEGSSESCRDSDLEIIAKSNASSCKKENVKCSTTGSMEYSKRIGSPEFEKTKRLPLSAYDTDEVHKSDKSSNAEASDANIKKLKLDLDCGNQKPDLKSSDSNEEDNRRKEEPSSSKFCTDETLEGSEKTKEASAQENASTKPDKSSKRPICQYEFDCFRRNPQHKMDFSHPGDPDYVVFENRPFCQYGRACCRTNRSHKIEFRHDGSPLAASPRPPSSIASSPLPTKRRRKKLKRSSGSDDEDEDEYDLEDPFINDASSDEYVPSDSNSEEDLDESQETY